MIPYYIAISDFYIQEILIMQINFNNGNLLKHIVIKEYVCTRGGGVKVKLYPDNCINSHSHKFISNHDPRAIARCLNETYSLTYLHQLYCAALQASFNRQSNEYRLIIQTLCLTLF